MIRGAWNVPRAARRLAPDAGAIVVDTAATPVRRGSRTAWLAGAEGAEGLTAASDPLPALAELGDGWLACVSDGAGDRLWLAVDPLGARSLHYAVVGAGVVFAEDVVDVLDLLETTPGPDEEAFAAWLAYGIVPAEQSLYAGVRRLPPGTALVAGPGGLATRTYWSPRYAEPFDDPRPVLAERLRAEVDAAVARGAAGAARPGVLLSGGLDSATVAASLRHGGTPPVAFSSTFPTDELADETAIIRHVVAELGLEAVEDPVLDGDPIGADLEFLDRWRLPSTSPNTWIALPQLRGAAAAGVDVMFDGEGGDELFGTDPFPVISDRFAGGQLVEAWRMTRRVPGRATASRRTRLQILAYFLRRDLPPPGLRRAAERARRRGSVHLRVLQRQRVAQAVATFGEWDHLHGDGPRWWRARLHALTGLRHVLDAPGSLRRTAAMAGLQPRHPLLLDSRLVAFTLRLPPEALFDPRFSRALARDAQAGRVPDLVRLSTRKGSFSSVLTTTLVRDATGRLPDLLDPATSRLGAFCRRSELEAWRAAALRGALHEGGAGVGQLRRLCVGEAWLRQLDST